MINSNTRNLLRTNHQIKDEYFQNYFDEFWKKTGLRYFGSELLERLVNKVVEGTWNGKLRY